MRYDVIMPLQNDVASCTGGRGCDDLRCGLWDDSRNLVVPVHAGAEKGDSRHIGVSCTTTAKYIIRYRRKSFHIQPICRQYRIFASSCIFSCYKAVAVREHQQAKCRAEVGKRRRQRCHVPQRLGSYSQ
ncbi:hypothetical protein NDU88_005831 [Pleurodeles waltl]|uniref:Uncharacterized protein n=1 Tax=Pleurodeles waltl TaxID=8319 RepID=A0AAV7PKP4_PLEWA|nr:hypothetical protein NDU88_005831 [Pleurodeles waltl]